MLHWIPLFILLLYLPYYFETLYMQRVELSRLNKPMTECSLEELKSINLIDNHENLCILPRIDSGMSKFDRKLKYQSFCLVLGENDKFDVKWSKRCKI